MVKAKILLILITALISLVHVNAQLSDDKPDCDGHVYKGKEVSRKAKILSYPAPDRPNDSRIDQVKEPVILDVVACRDGRITDIKVVQNQPYGLTEAAIKAARKIKFRPAEKDSQVVSQKLILEYDFRLP